MSKLKQFKFIDPTDNDTIYYLAEREYDNYNDVRKQIWHREDGPAKIIYYNDGSIWYEAYYINGKIHREDGSAYISYCKDGSIYYEVYYIDDKKYTKEEYDREMIKRNSKIGKELYE